MKIFIGIKYYQDKRNADLIDELKDIIRSSGYEPYSFADEGYIRDEKEMMDNAFQKLDECDILLLEVSERSFGIGIEAGYSITKKKKIITVIHESKTASRALKGISNYYLPYENLQDLKGKLRKVLEEIGER